MSDEKINFFVKNKILIFSLLLFLFAIFVSYYYVSSKETYTDWSDWSNCDENLKRKRTRKFKEGLFSKKIDNPVLEEVDDCLICFNQIEFGEGAKATGDGIITRKTESKDGDIWFQDNDLSKKIISDPLSRRRYLANLLQNDSDCDGWYEQKHFDEPMKAFKRKNNGKFESVKPFLELGNKYPTRTIMSCLLKNKIPDSDLKKINKLTGQKFDIYHEDCDKGTLYKNENNQNEIYYSDKIQKVGVSSKEDDQKLFKPNECKYLEIDNLPRTYSYPLWN